MGCLHFRQGNEPNKKRRFFRWIRNLCFGNWKQQISSSSASSEGNNKDNLTPAKLNDITRFSLAELKAATRNFHEKIGEGGFGAVYKGLVRLKSGKSEESVQVAVKKLNVRGMQGQREWLSEITYLRMVDHPNLVKLIGYCVEDDERGPESLLVYEYMPNKSLDEHIFEKSRLLLPWRVRIEIALGTARALAHLHEEVKPQIIYRDLKAGNILLDNEFKPKLSDFGLARYGPEIGDTHVTTHVVGTPGYAAPEYMQTGHLTAKSDVWSYGMVLLELLTGRRALDRNRPRNERNLADWAKPYMNDSRRFQQLIDPRLKQDYPLNEARRLLSLVQSCAAKYPKSRPSMSQVVKQLVEILDSGSSMGRAEGGGRRSGSRRSTASVGDSEGYLSGDSSATFSSKSSFQANRFSSGNLDAYTQSDLSAVAEALFQASSEKYGKFKSEEAPPVETGCATRSSPDHNRENEAETSMQKAEECSPSESKNAAAEQPEEHTQEESRENPRSMNDSGGDNTSTAQAVAC